MEHLLREVGALLHEESSTPLMPQAPQQHQQPPQAQAAPSSGFLLPHAARSRLLAAADALQGLAGMSQADAREAGDFLLPARAMGAVEVLEEAFKVLDEIVERQQQLPGQGGLEQQQPPQQQRSPPPPPQQQQPTAPAAAAPAPAPAPAPAAAAGPPPPAPQVGKAELAKEDRAKLQGLMALVLKHSGAFGPSSGPLIGDEKELLRRALAEMGGVLREETEGAYGESVDAYLEKYPQALDEYRRLQNKLAVEGSPFAAPSGPPPPSQPARSYKEQLALAKQARAASSSTTSKGQ